MLILSRGRDETIVIGDDIKVTVIGVTGNQVRFGIEAPKSIAVHRDEVYQRIQAETGAATPHTTGVRQPIVHTKRRRPNDL